jgi:hypothetical protein
MVVEAPSVDVPSALVLPTPEFADAYAERAAEGLERLRHSSVAFVGLARNCAGPLASNLGKLNELAACCGKWRLHIESNDCEDETLEVLHRYCLTHPQATFHYQTLDRPDFGSEFAGRRTQAMAEHRTACQKWVRSCAADADYVCIIDWDCWGGWMHDGVLNAVGWLVEMPGAFGMASVSLFKWKFPHGVTWAHYDLWALRGLGQARCYWDAYQKGFGGFAYQWFPPVGSPPVLVSSAFGGMAIYRTDAYLAGTYDGSDCEHVPFHRSIAEATGQHLYICPAMRTVMHWMEPADAGQHGND